MTIEKPEETDTPELVTTEPLDIEWLDADTDYFQLMQTFVNAQYIPGGDL